MPPRRTGNDPAALRDTALDRVPARVSRLAPCSADAARSIHRALLPRRGDGVRRRPSPVRVVSPRRLRPLRRAVARSASRPGRRRCDRRSSPSGAVQRGDARAEAPPRAAGRRARRGVRARRGRASPRSWSPTPPLDTERVREPAAATGEGSRRRHHAAVAPGASCSRAGSPSCRCSTRPLAPERDQRSRSSRAGSTPSSSSRVRLSSIPPP